MQYPLQGDYSCIFSEITCPINKDCSITGESINSLSDASIICPSDAQCDIYCNNSSSCSESIFYGTDASELTIICNDDYSCFDIAVFCPPSGPNDTKNCIISGTHPFRLQNKIKL